MILTTAACRQADDFLTMLSANTGVGYGDSVHPITLATYRPGLYSLRTRSLRFPVVAR